MPELTISHKGLELHGPAAHRLPGPAGKLSGVPTQAFPFTMSSNVIERMIACATGGGHLELAFGDVPTIHFGDTAHIITPTPANYHYDLYLTKPYESTRSAQKVPNTMSFITPKHKNAPSNPLAKKREVPGARGVAQKDPSKELSAKGRKVDSDVQKLQSSLAAAKAGKSHTSTLQSTLPKGGGNNSKLLQPTPKSLTNSPADLSAQPSPSATQIAVERAKEQRFAMVHELAVRDQTRVQLEGFWNPADIGFEMVLEKVADFLPDTQRYSMKRNYWKELDVWRYPYQTTEDRQLAIKNAKQQYNRMRLAHSEAQWQRLLPVDERNKGKHPNDATSSDDVAKPAAARPTPATIPTAATDARLKRLISKTSAAKKAASAASTNTSSRASPTAPATSSAAASKARDKAPPARALSDKDRPAKRVLSSEIVDDSDSADEALSKKKPVARPSKPAVSALSATTTTTTTTTKARPTSTATAATTSTRPTAAVKSVAKPVAAKRPRESDVADETSSSSSTPLSKRAKLDPKQSKPATASSSLAHHSTTAAPTTAAGRPKSTSPAKSSPLTLSPTNASDIEKERQRPYGKTVRDAEQTPRHRDVKASRKRMAPDDDDDGHRPRAKRQDVAPHTVDKAVQFQKLYKSYEALDQKLRKSRASSDDTELVNTLISMRNDLMRLKAAIYAEAADE